MWWLSMKKSNSMKKTFKLQLNLILQKYLEKSKDKPRKAKEDKENENNTTNVSIDSRDKNLMFDEIEHFEKSIEDDGEDKVNSINVEATIHVFKKLMML